MAFPRPRPAATPRPKKPKKPKAILDPNYPNRGWGRGPYPKPKPKPKPRPSPSRPPGAAAPGSGPGAAPAPFDPYAGPIGQIDRDQAAHQSYVSDKVMPWLSQSLAALTGVDPANPGYNPVIQQQFLGNVSSQVAGSLASAAGATPMNPASVTPGGIVAAPNAYQGTAMRAASSERGSAAISAAQAQAALNTLGPNTFAQGAVMQMADYAKGLPEVYVRKRSEMRAKIDQWIAESQQQAAEAAETERHHRVGEAISATNAQTNAAIQFGHLGLDTTDQAHDNQPAPGQPTNLPPGTVSVPNDQGGWDVRNDPTYVKPGSGGSSAPGAVSNKPLTPSQRSSMQGSWARPKNSPPKLGPGWKQPVWDSGTKKWYAKKGPAGAGAPKPPKVETATRLQSQLNDLYRTPGGWEERYDNNPDGAGKEIARWVRENKASFTTNGKVDFAKLISVLGTVGGRPAAEAKRILKGYYNGAGVWK